MTPSCDADDSDKDDFEESVEDNKKITDHESEDNKQNGISYGTTSELSTGELSVLRSTSTAMERPRKSYKNITF